MSGETLSSPASVVPPFRAHPLHHPKKSVSTGILSEDKENQPDVKTLVEGVLIGGYDEMVKYFENK